MEEERLSPESDTVWLGVELLDIMLILAAAGRMQYDPARDGTTARPPFDCAAFMSRQGV
jgi:hypothetical protein